MLQVSNSLDETKTIAENFVQGLTPHEDRAIVVGLYGDLGAGKTTFTQAVARALGVSDTVTSPTFVIEKIYELTNQNFTHLIHIDAYRIDSSDEFLHLGWRDIISDPHHLILIEWPERVADIMPEHIQVRLAVMDDENSRKVEVV